nr:uncharacterized protein slp1 [Quercus suber]
MLRVIRFASSLILLTARCSHTQATAGGNAAEKIAGDTSPIANSPSRTANDAVSTSILPASTCRSKTVNYITHTLPQQCLRTDRTASEVSFGPPSSNQIDERSKTFRTPLQDVSLPPSQSVAIDQIVVPHTTGIQIGVATTSSPLRNQDGASVTTNEIGTLILVGNEIESESPLDNANFLSFEEWKKQNLAKAGQSLDNIGHERTRYSEGERHRPGINNALDGLGEENEIDLDFGGFGGVRPSPSPSANQPSAPSDTPQPDASSPGTITIRSKDAGKTCKERTNYASFDCAATVLKNNNECKSASSVLVEHKDSYMLNTCSAKNKYFIVELCNDILIDTIVLANYEFFSSSFRHFRVSVSDRFPVKNEKWKDLGTFEAHNTREVQAFLVEEPLIWARYLRIEFLSHYGNEYYCPVSLLRVHGTTMMQEFRNQEELARGELNDDDPTLQTEVALGEPVLQERRSSTDEAEISDLQFPTKGQTGDSMTVLAHSPDQTEHLSMKVGSHVSSNDETVLHGTDSVSRDVDGTSVTSSTTSDIQTTLSKNETSDSQNVKNTAAEMISEPSVKFPASVNNHISATSLQLVVTTVVDIATAESSSAQSMESSQDSAETTTSPSTRSTPLESTLAATGASANASAIDISANAASSTRSSSSTASSSPPVPQPSTQESFFKSIHKRLQQLESNSTLSLQYIEEQSRILRDAFGKVEKRQLATTTTFLSSLNATVMTELHGFRQAYDQLWQSTVIELDSQREQNQREMLALSSRLTLVADELVWQKRMGILQSTLLLLCLGVVLFARQGSGYLELPLVQQSANKATLRSMAGGWESDPNSPSPESTTPASRSPIRFLRRMPRGIGVHTAESQPDIQNKVPLDEIEQSSPEVSLDQGLGDGDDSNDSDELDEGISETQSGPVTPHAMRDAANERPPSWPDDGKPSIRAH